MTKIKKKLNDDASITMATRIMMYLYYIYVRQKSHCRTLHMNSSTKRRTIRIMWSCSSFIYYYLYLMNYFHVCIVEWRAHIIVQITRHHHYKQLIVKLTRFFPRRTIDATFVGGALPFGFGSIGIDVVGGGRHGWLVRWLIVEKNYEQVALKNWDDDRSRCLAV